MNTKRRTFMSNVAGTAAAAVAAGSATSHGSATAAASPDSGPKSDFPRDWWWGAATASYQVEGAAGEDGRKPSVWDTFSKTPGRIKDSQSGDIACEHYHRFADDVKLMAELGIKHYRFSIAWPRIIPDGRGAVNEKGVDFYRRLVDTLLAQGITPHATLFHWDSPQALEDRYGSWRSREMAKDFADYCSATVQRLGDRVQHWMTINEIECFTFLGYGVKKVPQHAPGTVLETRKELFQVVHHALLAHGLGAQAIRAASPGKCQVSLVNNTASYVPWLETPEHIEAAKRAYVSQEVNGTIIVPALTGRYDPVTWAALGADAPDVQPGDLETIHQPLDAFGLNLYTGSYVRAADNARGYEVLPLPAGYPQMHMPWLNFLPESLYWAVRFTSEALGRKDLPIYISENGCAAADTVSSGGEVLDTNRILYLRSYLRNAKRALDEGYPLKGYFLWSLMDNFEWSWGYLRRFGITYVDYATQQRIPKLSFRWYQEVIRQNRVL